MTAPFWGRLPNRQTSALCLLDSTSVLEVFVVDVALGQAARIGEFIGKYPQGYGRTAEAPEQKLPTGERLLQK